MTLKMLKKRLGLEAIERNYLNSAAEYYKIPSTLIIPEGCEKVGYRAFWGCHGLKKVEIPESVEEIRSWAFDWCYNAEIILKKPKRELKFLGSWAFSGCRYVKEETRD